MCPSVSKRRAMNSRQLAVCVGEEVARWDKDCLTLELWVSKIPQE